MNPVEQTVDALPGGKPVPASTTQPYGCSVKYKGPSRFQHPRSAPLEGEDMFAVLSVVAVVAVAQSPSQDCREVRNVRALARKHRMDDATLYALEKQYCTATEGKKVKLPSAPTSVSGKPAECVEAQLVEQLAAFDPDKEDLEVMKSLRDSVCRGKPASSELRYSNGRLARSSTGVWNFPSGRLARALGAPWLYPNQKIAGHAGGIWQYPNGGTARYSDGRWKSPKGSPGTLAAVFEECRRAGGCSGPKQPPKGAEDLHAAWFIREVWRVLGQ